MWRFLKKLEIELPYDPAIPLLGIHTEETRIERDTCTPMFISALFTIARTWKQPRYPLADEWIRKPWYIYTMEYSVQFSHSVMCNSLRPPWTEACQASLSITNSQSLLKFMFIELVMPSNHLILCHPLTPRLSIFPNIRVLSNESVLCIRWPKCWSFSFSISPFNEYSGLIFFRIDWFL